MEVFQREAQEELQSVAQQAEQQQTLPTSHLAELLARGEEFRVHIPELELLRVVRHTHTHTHTHHCSVWTAEHVMYMVEPPV